MTKNYYCQTYGKHQGCGATENKLDFLITHPKENRRLTSWFLPDRRMMEVWVTNIKILEETAHRK